MSDTKTEVLRYLDTNDPPTVLKVSRMLSVSPQRIYQILDDEDVPTPTQRRESQENAA